MTEKREINKESIKMAPSLKKGMPHCFNCKFPMEKVEIVGTGAGIAHNIFECPICGRKRALR